jgi:hypothetical protein
MFVAMAVNAVIEGAGGAGVKDGVVFVPTFGTVPIRVLSGFPQGRIKIRLTAFGSLRSRSKGRRITTNNPKGNQNK